MPATTRATTTTVAAKIGTRDFWAEADTADDPEAEKAAMAGEDGEADGEECTPEDPATPVLDAGAEGVATETDSAETGAAAMTCGVDSCAAETAPEVWAIRPDSVSRLSR